MFVRSKRYKEIVWSLANLKTDYDYISVGHCAFDCFLVLAWLFRKKCVRVFIGTDVLKCRFYWHYRFRVKLLSFFCENITVAEWLTKELNELGIEAKTVIHNESVILLSWLKKKNML